LKANETCVLMTEKAKICGPDYGKSATSADNHLSARVLPTVRIINLAGGVTDTDNGRREDAIMTTGGQGGEISNGATSAVPAGLALWETREIAAAL
jgi:hypothetical protein